MDQAAINAQLDAIDAATKALRGLVAVVPPPVVVVPPLVPFSLTLPASAFVLSGSAGMVLAGDHISDWGHPGETAAAVLHAQEPTMATLVFDYVLAKSASVASTRTVVGSTVTFPNTCDVWTAPVHGKVAVTLTVPAGDSNLVIRIPENSPDWSEWLDLYGVKVISDKAVTLVATPVILPPPVLVPPVPTKPPVIPPPMPGPGKTWNVPADGSLQTVANNAAPGDTIYVNGIVGSNDKQLVLANRHCENNPVVVIGNPGSVLRSGTSGIEGYGSNRGWTFQNLLLEIDAKSYYGEGVYFDGSRKDNGGDGQGCAQIRVLNVVVRPIAGTGNVQRGGVTLWGGDVLEVSYCDISNVGWNDVGFFGGAASAISIGQTIGASLANLANGSRVWLHHNLIRNVFGPGTAAADRNGIILDGYQANANCLRGVTEIHDNDIQNCEGRGIHVLLGGFVDSPINIRKNLVRAPIGGNLGGSEPICGIGGYGGGKHGNILCSDNDVLSGVADYKWLNFDAEMAAEIRGVRGTGNKGVSAVFEASPGNSMPVGFLV